jgi:hypothetical protein
MKKLFIVLILLVLASFAFAASNVPLSKTLRIIDRENTVWIISIDQIAAIRISIPVQYDITNDGKLSSGPGRHIVWAENIWVLFNNGKDPIYFTIWVTDKSGIEALKILDQVEARLNLK